MAEPSRLKIKPLLQRIFSSLFARRMTKVMFGVPGTEAWYYTNIPPEVMLLYRSDMQWAIHELTFRDKEIRDAILNRFPILGTMSGCLDTTELTAVLNKVKNPDEYQIRVKPNTTTLEMYCTVKSDDALEPRPVGVLLEHDILKCYHDLFEKYLNRSQWNEDNPMVVHPVELDKFDKSLVTLVPVINRPPESLHAVYCINLPIRDGVNAVSIVEYGRRIDPPGTVDIIVCYDSGDSMKTAIRYKDAEIKIVSVQPAALWFPVKRQLS